MPIAHKPKACFSINIIDWYNSGNKYDSLYNTTAALLVETVPMKLYVSTKMPVTRVQWLLLAMHYDVEFEFTISVGFHENRGMLIKFTYGDWRGRIRTDPNGFLHNTMYYNLFLMLLMHLMGTHLLVRMCVCAKVLLFTYVLWSTF